jgi:hypothetical protein
MPGRSEPGLRRRRRWGIAVAAFAVVAMTGAAFALGDRAPVGYYRSAQALDQFRNAYEQAMHEMPEPDRTVDVRTSYGVVRLYHFTGADPDAAPLLLLPGRTSATPVWADNMPTLLRVRSAYTIDLLGEPGMSIQQRAISSPNDHAQWLHEVLVALPEPRLHLFGLSIGGWTATNLAVHRPEKIASVMVLDPVMVFADLSSEAIIRSISTSVHWFPQSWRDSFSSWTANDAPV